MIKLAIAAAISVAASAGGSAATLEEARDVYDQNRVAAAEQIYSAIAGTPARSASDRAEANIELARIAWLIDGNAEAALTRLAAARGTGAKPCETGLMEVRVLREAGRLDQAAARGRNLLGECMEPRKRDLIGLQLLRAHLDVAAAEPKRRKAALAAAAVKLGELGIDAASGLEGAAARLEIGLLTGDSATAQKGWSDYFWLTNSDGPPALASLKPATRIESGLASNATDQKRAELAELLVRAGFAEPARRFAAGYTGPSKAVSPTWRALLAYWRERDELLAVLLQVNRRLARGGPKDDPALQKAAMEALGALMAAAGASGDPRRAVLDHYGLLGSVGVTSGYPSLHIGHVVDDRREFVQQYGHRAEVRFAAIDNMWANGFESWLWDGSAQSGGWVGDETIIHVRSAYTSAPVAAFALLGDTPARRELMARLPTQANDDLAKAKTGAPATMASVNTRLRLQFLDQIAAIVRAKSPADFRRAFLDEYWRANLQHSIFLHEGRHSIDKALAPDPSKLDNAELEYTAKLSELALSDYPRMALWNMNRGIGGSSPHEIAGTRILGEYARWVRQHGPEIRGYDPGSPAEVQIDKLSDDQIRSIAKGLDPLASGKGTTASAGSPSGTSR